MPFFLLRSSFFHFSLIKLFQHFISTRWYVVLYRHCVCPPPPIIFNGSIYVKIAALFLQNIAPPQKSSNESRSAIESYYVTRLQVPLRSPVWYTNKRCVFNYLPLHVTIDPSIIIFSQVSILLLLYHDHYTQEKKAHSALPLSSSLWWPLLSVEPDYSWWQLFPNVG